MGQRLGGRVVSPVTAAVAPLLGAALAVPALVIFASPGDWRRSAAPWFFAAVPACLAVTCVGIAQLHRRRWVTIGALWTALALTGLGGFFLAVGIGGLTGLQDLPEEQLGLLAWLPVLGFGFGFFSLTPALVVTAVSTGRAGLLPRWAVWSLWLLAPLLPITFAIGGNGPESIREYAPLIGLVVILVGWVVVGQAVRRGASAGGDGSVASLDA